MSAIKIMHLSEVCRVYQPETISKKSLPADGIYPVYGANGKIGLNDKFNHEDPQLLLGCRGSVGSIHISEAFSWINGNAMVVTPFEDLVTRDYLKYALFGGINIKDAISGTAQPQITRETLSKIKIPVPSLKKQSEIIERLDKAFAEIDSLEKNLKLKDEKTNQLSQSMLSAAFINREDFDVKVTKLVEVCNLIGGGTPSKANQDFYLGDINWATVRDLNKRWLDKTEYRINKKAVQESSTNIIPSGNVVIATRVGLGKVVQLAHETAINQDLRALVPKKDGTLNSNYLFYWAISISSKIVAAGKGATVQGVTLPFLENLEILLPSLEKQEVIVNRLDRAFSEIDKLKNQISIEKERISSLRQSILSNAFNFKEKAA